MSSNTETPPTVEFDVPYSENCPECAKAGNVVPLGLVLAEGIVCASGGHHFDQMPGGEAKTPPQGQMPQDAPKAAHGVAITGLDKKLYSGNEAKIQVSEQETRDRMIERTQEVMRENARKGVAPSTLAISKAVQSEVIEESKGPAVEVRGLTPIGGGDLGFTLILRERFVGYIQQEAVNQRQTPEVYLQEFLDRCLENQWS